MQNQVPAEAIQKVQGMLQPWFAALKDPAQSQENVLQNLLKIYAQTEYGQSKGADAVGSLEEYRRKFPVMDYEGFRPLIKRVMAGEVHALLDEPPLGWAITRGTTKGETKFIPMTPTDLKMRVSAGRAVMNYAMQTKAFDIFSGVNLNLNFPSIVGTVNVGERELEYGYSSGIYTKHVSTLTPVRSVPSQAEIDALGGGKTIRDWEARFELAFNKCKEENVTLVGGVAPTTMDFGRYLYHKHKCYPKDHWQTRIMTLGSVAGINTRLADSLHAMYGDDAAIREIYGATEGMFGQQMDEKRAWVPNYDLFFFEVQVGSRIMQLHEMKPGQTGSLIVSTPVLPRYKIGDLIRAYQAPYFRCIGREIWWTPLKHLWEEFQTFNLDRL